MSSSNKKKQTGLWFVGLLGAIAAIMGIRYASSEGWWSNLVNREKLAAYQTVNTGASIPILALDSGQAVPVGGGGVVGGAQPQPASLQGTGDQNSEKSPRRGRW